SAPDAALARHGALRDARGLGTSGRGRCVAAVHLSGGSIGALDSSALRSGGDHVGVRGGHRHSDEGRVPRARPCRIVLLADHPAGGTDAAGGRRGRDAACVPERRHHARTAQERPVGGVHQRDRPRPVRRRRRGSGYRPLHRRHRELPARRLGGGAPAAAPERLAAGPVSVRAGERRRDHLDRLDAAARGARRPMRVNRLQFGAGVLLSAVCLAVAFRRADFSAVASMLGGADYHWLLWYPVLGVALNVVRSEIWRLLLRGRAGRVDAFWAYGTGFLVNNVLPLRVGEAARVGLLAARCRLPLLEVAAAAGLERALDI